MAHRCRRPNLVAITLTAWIVCCAPASLCVPLHAETGSRVHGPLAAAPPQRPSLPRRVALPHPVATPRTVTARLPAAVRTPAAPGRLALPNRPAVAARPTPPRATPRATPPARAAGTFPSIACSEFTLQNGLRVILHEDHSIPIVAVNVWYHVGSKNEAPGRTGFAHLFEHLMFQGSKHYNEDYFKPLQAVGATVNATTNADRTNFWEVVPSNFLELALSMEADRMGYLLDALTEARLDNQREVVKNEKRQNFDNRPYGLAFAKIMEALYPPQHPYHWLPIGSLDDISGASLGDVQQFFRSYYVPSNASLVLAGDFDPVQVRRSIEKYFGPLPTGLAVRPVAAPPVKLEHEVRITMPDRVAVPRLYLVWPTVPEWSPDEPALDILASGLADSKMARLYKTLVYDRQIAQDVAAHHDAREIGGQFVIAVTLRPGKSLIDVENAIDVELLNLKMMPPTAFDLERDYNALEARFFYELQTVNARADQLNRYATFRNHPNAFQEDLARYRHVTAADIQRVIGKYLTDKRVVLSVVPADAAPPDAVPAGGVAPQNTVASVQQTSAASTTRPVAAVGSAPVAHAAVLPATSPPGPPGPPGIEGATPPATPPTAASDTPPASIAPPPAAAPSATAPFAAAPSDGYVRPQPQPDPPFTPPHIERRRLSNGLDVLIVERHALPIVNLKLVVKTGAAADPPQRAGLAAMTADLLDEGTGSRSALAISDELSGLGAVMATEVGWDVTDLGLMTLTRHLNNALGVFSAMVADPAFPVRELERLRAARLVALQQRRDNPNEIAPAIYASLLYGGNHPYGHVPGGLEADVSAIQQDDVRRFYDTYYRPNNAALIVVGDVQPDTLMPRLERAFFGWKKSAAAAPVAIPEPPVRDQAAIYLVDKPGAAQSLIMMGQVGVARATPDYFPLQVLNNLLGGQFSSRINLDLRQDKGYTYAARTAFSYRRSRGPFAATAGVETAVTTEAVAEFLKELSGLRGALPVTQDEVETARQSIIRSFPRSFETPAQIADRLTDVALYDLPDDYFDTYLAHVRAVSVSDVQRVANRHIDPSRMTILIVGDRRAVEPGLRTLAQIGPTLTLLDSDGHRITQ